MKEIITPLIIIFFLTFCTLCIEDGGEKWQSGKIIIDFNPGINTTEAREIIESYNLTISWITDPTQEDIYAEVEVPDGEEESYIELLKENRKIEDVVRVHADPS